ncbi:hypothetical protein ACIBKY_26655 [Nonomuraea sp. NPDC050394]|uniref:hypothetical protein n=1 Tax=Nonomuraea sp. NPDC050394 TaxID=3364363 RepID=UPI0037B23EEE
MSVLATAASEPDWFARGLGAAGLAVSVIGQLLTWRTFRRGGYKIKVKASVSVEDLEKYPEPGFIRKTYVNVIVSNHRAGEVQVVGFHGDDSLNPVREIGLFGDLPHTLKGISQERWRTSGTEEPADPAQGSRGRIGAELANGRIIWSNWFEMGPKAAEQVLAPRL